MEFDLNVAAGLDTFEDDLYENEAFTSYHDSSEEEAHVFQHSPILVDENSPSRNDVELEPGTGERKEDDVLDLDNSALIITDIEAKLGAGVKFGSLEEAQILYFEYGRLKGFSVRLGNQRCKGGTNDIRWKDYECQCGGRPVKLTLLVLFENQLSARGVLQGSGCILPTTAMEHGRIPYL